MILPLNENGPWYFNMSIILLLLNLKLSTYGDMRVKFYTYILKEIF